ncbi:hypothetical protein LSAT2_029452 [Lamellibrachia satsuma]|nr:hypothetical protein LSAT2_029452 [Lamellibrachia satsuma]
MSRELGWGKPRVYKGKSYQTRGYLCKIVIIRLAVTVAIRFDLHPCRAPSSATARFRSLTSAVESSRVR